MKLICKYFIVLLVISRSTSAYDLPAQTKAANAKIDFWINTLLESNEIHLSKEDISGLETQFLILKQFGQMAVNDKLSSVFDRLKASGKSEMAEQFNRTLLRPLDRTPSVKEMIEEIRRGENLTLDDEKRIRELEKGLTPYADAIALLASLKTKESLSDGEMWLLTEALASQRNANDFLKILESMRAMWSFKTLPVERLNSAIRNSLPIDFFSQYTFKERPIDIESFIRTLSIFYAGRDPANPFAVEKFRKIVLIKHSLLTEPTNESKKAAEVFQKGYERKHEIWKSMDDMIIGGGLWSFRTNRALFDYALWASSPTIPIMLMSVFSDQPKYMTASFGAYGILSAIGAGVAGCQIILKKLALKRNAPFDLTNYERAFLKMDVDWQGIDLPR